MKSMQKINKFEAIALIVIITINQIILNLPSTIILNTGSSAWINIIIISILAILFCILICKLFKRFPSNDIIDISEYLGGKFFKIFVGILYISFFVLISALFLRYFSNNIKQIYFEKSPIVFLLLLFLIPISFAAKLGIKSIARANLILTPIVLISMLILFISTAKLFIPQNIFPILGFGADETFLIGLTNIYSFVSFAYIYFLIPLLKNPEDFKKISIWSIVISAINLFLGVICLIMLFPFIPFSDEMLSIYLVARLIEFGKFLQRVDAVFILIWILSLFSFLSINISFINKILKKLLSLKNYREMSFSVCAIIFSISLLFTNISNIKFTQTVLLKYFTIGLVFIFSFIILVIANLKFKKEKT